MGISDTMTAHMQRHPIVAPPTTDGLPLAPSPNAQQFDSKRNFQMLLRSRYTDIHEAGHASMFWLFGTENNLKQIDMRGDESSVAFVRGRQPTAKWVEVFGDRRMAVMALMHYLSGPAAEAKVREQDEWFDAEFRFWELHRISATDTGKAVAAAQAIYGDTGRRWSHFLAMVAKWTREAIDEPCVWRAIVALADRLEGQQTMRGTVANKIMAAAGGINYGMPILKLGPKWKGRLITKFVPDE